MTAIAGGFSESGTTLERTAPDFIAADETLRPLRDRIVVRQLEWKPSQIIAVIPGQRTLRGEVIAAGPGTWPWRYSGDRSRRWHSRQFRATEVKIGDVVALEGHDYPRVTIDGAMHVICQEGDVCGIETGNGP
jgi:co-chaperonin GroES (HSP10)